MEETLNFIPLPIVVSFPFIGPLMLARFPQIPAADTGNFRGELPTTEVVGSSFKRRLPA